MCVPDDIPEHITAAITVLPPNEKIDLNNISPHNRFSLALAALPVKRNTDILKTVEFLHNDFNMMRNSVDVVVSVVTRRLSFVTNRCS